MSHALKSTRRTALTAAMWSAPAIAVSAAAPAYATSTSPLYAVNFVTPSPPGVVTFTVTFNDAALALAARGVLITIERQSDTGDISDFDSPWSATFMEAVWLISVPSNPALVTEIAASFTGPATWMVNLVTPNGTLRYPLEILAAPQPAPASALR